MINLDCCTASSSYRFPFEAIMRLHRYNGRYSSTKTLLKKERGCKKKEELDICSGATTITLLDRLYHEERKKERRMAECRQTETGKGLYCSGAIVVSLNTGVMNGDARLFGGNMATVMAKDGNANCQCNCASVLFCRKKRKKKERRRFDRSSQSRHHSVTAADACPSLCKIAPRY